MWIIASLALATVLFVIGFVIWWSDQNPPFRKPEPTRTRRPR